MEQTLVISPSVSNALAAVTPRDDRGADATARAGAGQRIHGGAHRRHVVRCRILGGTPHECTDARMVGASRPHEPKRRTVIPATVGIGESRRADGRPGIRRRSRGSRRSLRRRRGMALPARPDRTRSRDAWGFRTSPCFSRPEERRATAASSLVAGPIGGTSTIRSHRQGRNDRRRIRPQRRTPEGRDEEADGLFEAPTSTVRRAPPRLRWTTEDPRRSATRGRGTGSDTA